MPNPLGTPTPTRPVFAGPLSAEYEQGELRYVRFGEREVLRRVYVAVRDHNWETTPCHVRESRFESDADTFRIELEARHESGGIVFEWHGLIQGGADGGIRLEMSGEPKTEFLRNRIGICVLHPMETCAGENCEIEHTDGVRETSRFPELVEPHQPFLALRALSYPVAPGVQAEVRFLGDEFETEDQRNWSDFTFKTYSTRLSIPIPVRVKPGDRVQQSFELRLTGNDAVLGGARQPAAPVEITIHPETTLLPKVGVVHHRSVPAMGAFTRVDVAFADPKWTEQLSDAMSWRLPLEIACLSDDPEADLPRLATELQRLRASVLRFLLFPASGLVTDPRSIPAARKAFGPRAVIAAGSRGHFADLNRNREIIAAADQVVWPVDPYVHAADYRTVIENLQGQVDAPRTARTFSGARSLVISAVRVPDIETRTGWLAVSLKQLAQHGAASITYDLRGVAVPELSHYLGHEIVHCTSSHPLRADALVVKGGADKASAVTAFVTNFSNEPVQVRIRSQVVSLSALESRQVRL